MCAALGIGMVVLVVNVLISGTTTAFLVQCVARFFRPGYGGLAIWINVMVMTLVTLVTAAGHLAQISVWALVLVLTGEAVTFEAAFYCSAQNYTALGYGDIIQSERWRLLGPLEAINGLLLFGVSTALMFAVMSRLIRNRFRLPFNEPTEK
jgi:hypothetical protein